MSRLERFDRADRDVAQRSRTAELAARRAELTQRDLSALARMLDVELPTSRFDRRKMGTAQAQVELVWCVIRAAHRKRISVAQLLLPSKGDTRYTFFNETPSPLNPAPTMADVRRAVAQDPRFNAVAGWLIADNEFPDVVESKRETFGTGKSLGMLGPVEFFRE